MKNFSPVVANLAPATSATVTGTFDATGKITHIIVACIVKAQGFPKYSPNDCSWGFKARGQVADVPAGTLAIANDITDKNSTDGVSLNTSNTSEVEILQAEIAVFRYCN